MAVNGSNGAILWTTWLDDAVYAVNCVADLDLDGIIDCTVTGKSRVTLLKSNSLSSPSPEKLFIVLGTVGCEL